MEEAAEEGAEGAEEAAKRPEEAELGAEAVKDLEEAPTP